MIKSSKEGFFLASEKFLSILFVFYQSIVYIVSVSIDTSSLLQYLGSAAGKISLVG
jgi:hypothetical protein